jgi:ribosome-binding protein aMBF1 (putative translation factor)
VIELTRQREARRWTKRELGARADLHPSRVGVIKNGRVVPYDVELSRLAHALGFTGDPHDLLERADEAARV